MHSDSLKKFFDDTFKEIDKAVESGEDRDVAMDRLIPRMCYFGHKVIHTFDHPDKRARWECKSCKHQWVSKIGDICPSCKDCKHVWSWIDEPYGDNDRACKYCGITLKDSMGNEKFEDYIKNERSGPSAIAARAKLEKTINE